MAEEDKKRYEIEMANYISSPMMAYGGVAPTAAAAAAAAAGMARGGGLMMAPPPDAVGPGGRRRRRKKKMKDPNAPKRCMSAFFWYSQDERSKVRAANPDFAVGDIAKELGRRWSEAEGPVREKYEKLAAEDRARYDKAKRLYQQKLRDEQNGIVPGASTSAAAATAAPVAAAANAAAVPIDDLEEEELAEEELIESEEESEGDD